jgi:DNA-binding GntR family transcriptional regulator
VRKLNIPDDLTTLAYKAIRKSILEGDAGVESKLTEDALARKLGISKSPIREALTRLESEGLVRIAPRRGAFVVRFSARDVSELYGLREALEEYAVRNVTVSPELLDELRQRIEAAQACLRAEDLLSYIKEDVRFHRALAEATGNQRLIQALEHVQNQGIIFRRDTFHLSSNVSLEMHRRILAALEQNDREAAALLMRQHITTVRDKLVRYMQERGEKGSAASAGTPS